MAALPTGIAGTPGSNRFSRITKASAAVRLILVRSRRSDGRREEWSGLSESNRHLNLGKSAEKELSRTYEALSGTLSSPRSGQKRVMFLRLFPRNEEYRSGSDVPRGMRVGTLLQNREEVQSDRMHDTEDIGSRDLPIAPEISCS